MNKKELYSFFSYCEKISDSRNYAAYTESDPIWTGQREALYANGIIPGLYREKDEKLFSLISFLSPIKRSVVKIYLLSL